MSKSSPKNSLTGWITISVVAHMAVLALVIVLSSGQSRRLDDRNILPIRIVQKGKKPKEKLLPRKPRATIEPPKVIPPKVEPPKPEPPQEEKKAPKPEPKKAPKPKKKKPSKHQLKPEPKPKSKPKPKPKRKPKPKPIDPLKALEKRMKYLEKQGDENAPEYGNSITGEMLESYKARIKAMLERESIDLPSFIGEEERAKLLFLFRIFVDSVGTPTKVKVVKPSGSEVFDEVVIAAVNSVVTFGPPPVPLRAMLKNKGVEFEWTPTKSNRKDQ